jgi:hypothetical protein
MTAMGWRAAVQFALWAAVGAGCIVGVLTAPTIGLLVFPLTAVLAAVLLWRRHRLVAGPGILTGLGLAPCYIAYLNRGGPGTVCTFAATGGSCVQEWSPWPWLGVGLGFVIAGFVLLVRHRAQQAASASPASISSPCGPDEKSRSPARCRARQPR